MPRILALTLAVLAAVLLQQGHAAAAGVRDSVVRIEVTSRAPDFYRPWSKKSPSSSSGSGVMIEGNRILTNAHVVQHASQIQVQQHGASDKHAARVVAVGPGIDLAVLELEDASVAESIPPIAMSDELPKLRQSITAYGYPMGGEELSITEGVVSRIEFTSFYYEGLGLRIQVDAALNPGNSGGPALSDDKLIGLVFSKINEADNIGYLIPVEEIRDFLADVADGSYDGKPALYDDVNTTENRALRERLGLDGDTTGVVVEAPYGDDSVLKRWDVITHIGPHDIDNQGYVRLGDELRLRYLYQAPKCAENGKVPLTIFRDGESLEVQADVHRGRDLVLPIVGHGYPDYFIWGPLVFTTATQEVAVRGGPRMWASFMATDNPLLGRLRDLKRFPDEELVMIPNRLFPHRITRGYSNATLAVVESVDGQPVRNLPHLVSLLRDASGEFVEIDLAGRYESLVFRRREALEATEEILTDEGIRRQGSPELLKVWEASDE